MRPLLVFSFLFSVALHAAAEPARYLVFEQRNGRISLLADEPVDISIPDSLTTFATRHDERRVDVTVREGGVVVFRTSIIIDPYLRDEASERGAPIDGRWLLDARPLTFTVRVPDRGDTIEVAGGAIITPSAFRMTPITRAATVRSDSSANSENRLDILVMGDGYTAAEESKFGADAQRVTADFLSIAPYSNYRNFVNVRSHFVASSESGADHPVCADGGPDPLSGKRVDTAFDATYCTSGIFRLLTVNTGKVQAAARAVPDWDKILVIVNDSTYGGAGGSVSVTSTHASAVLVAQHEFGHSFTGLADEYTSPYPAYPACSDVHFTGCEPNVTDVSTRANIKWGAWIQSTTPVPTTFNGDASVLGLFVGARYQSSGYFRPKSDCAMNSLGSPFCEICSQAYVLRLYRGGWAGLPVKGIDLIEPGSESPRPGAVTTRPGDVVEFRATLLMPSGPRDPVVAQWFVDGEPAGVTGDSFSFVALPGTHLVELRVTDQTPMVASAERIHLVRTRAWTVDGGIVAAGPRRRSVGRR